MSWILELEERLASLRATLARMADLGAPVDVDELDSDVEVAIEELEDELGRRLSIAEHEAYRANERAFSPAA